MGCTVREKHVRANRKIQAALKSELDPCCLFDRIALSKSIVKSSLKNLVYHPGLTGSGPGTCCAHSNPSGSFEENVWGYCTEEHLEEILLKHLEFLYNQAVSKLIELGYEEGAAMRAVLSNGHYYGELDVFTNIVNNSLSYLNSSSGGGGGGNGNSKDQSETGFTDFRDLEEYSLAGMIYLLQQVKPSLSKGDAIWCLLMSELHVGRASTMDVLTSGNMASCAKEHSNIEGVGSTLDLAGFMAPILCRFHGGWDFGNGRGPEFSSKGFFMNNAEVKLQREIECPGRFNLSPSMKSLLKRNVAAFAAGFRASMKQKQIETETSGNIMSCTDPTHVETCENPRSSGSEETVGSVLEKFRELNLDDNLESVGVDDKDGVIVTLLHQVKDLEKKLRERKDWAQKKAMQAAKKVSDELAEIKLLNSEREGIQLLKKGKQAV